MVLPIATEEALIQLENHIRDFCAGTLSLDDFRRRRSAFGVYGLRGSRDRVVVRVKVPSGHLAADQLTRLGELTRDFSCERCHVTTRQAVQLYGVALDAVPGLLRKLGEVGLTSMESAGNRVRNVVACSFAGLCMDELFDVTPYALAVAAHFHGNVVSAALPRKFKIAFSGCERDCTMTATHDVGALAAAEGTQLGFRIYVGGGLGRDPRAGQLLERFTPVEQLLPTLDAIVRVFDQHGDRTLRSKARLRWLVRRISFEAFRDLVLKQRDASHDTLVHRPVPQPIPAEGQWAARWPRHDDAAYDRWLSTNVKIQRQPGYASIVIRLPRGDLAAGQCAGLADIARSFTRGQVRTSPSQNMILPWVELHNISLVYDELIKLDLALPEAERVRDIVTCPGASTCQIGVTRSRDLATALARTLDQPVFQADAVNSLRLCVSGCPNACSRHHVADIGFQGLFVPLHGQQAPHYEMLLGGGAEGGHAWFGGPVGCVPARRAPAALQTVLGYFQAERRAGESFRTFVVRTGTARLQDIVRPHTTIGTPAEDPDAYRDWDDSGR